MIMHDPFSMRPFFGYNFGDYLGHWLSLGSSYRNYSLPRIFMVNWFRKNESGKFIWPGFGENVRVIDWILSRVDGAQGAAVPSAIGNLPAQGALNLSGLDEDLDFETLMSIPKE